MAKSHRWTLINRLVAWVEDESQTSEFRMEAAKQLATLLMQFPKQRKKKLKAAETAKRSSLLGIR